MAHIISMPAPGGAENYVKDLAIAMKRSGHEPSVWFLSAAPDDGATCGYEQQFVGLLDAHGIGVQVLDGRGWLRVPRALLRVRRLVKSDKIGLIHAHLFQGILVSALATLPVVYTRHGMSLRLHPAVYRWVLDRIVRAYVAISTANASLLRAVVRRPVALIPNGVDLSGFTAARRNDASGSRRVRLVSVGRLVDLKDFAGMLRSLDSLESKNWSLALAGDGPERPRLEGLARALGLESQVMFLGTVTDVAGLLAESDVFVMNSISEGMPIALLEATAAGLPVIVTDVGGCAEVVRQVGHGIVVPAGSEAAYASALRQLIEDPALRAECASKAVTGAAQYSIKRCAEQHLELYLGLTDVSRDVADGERVG